MSGLDRCSLENIAESLCLLPNGNRQSIGSRSCLGRVDCGNAQCMPDLIGSHTNSRALFEIAELAHAAVDHDLDRNSDVVGMFLAINSGHREFARAGGNDQAFDGVGLRGNDARRRGQAAEGEQQNNTDVADVAISWLDPPSRRRTLKSCVFWTGVGLVDWGQTQPDDRRLRRCRSQKDRRRVSGKA